MVRFCADRKTEDWDVGREMKGWGLGERLALPPYDDDSGDDLSDESRCKESLNFVTPFVSSVMMRLSICPSSPRRKSVSKVREHSAVIKRATAQWHAWWSSKDRGSKIQLAAFRHRRCQTKLKGPMDKREIPRQAQRCSPQRGRTGHTRERKEEHLGQKLGTEPKYAPCREVWLTTPKLKTVTKARSGNPWRNSSVVILAYANLYLFFACLLRHVRMEPL